MVFSTTDGRTTAIPEPLGTRFTAADKFVSTNMIAYLHWTVGRASKLTRACKGEHESVLPTLRDFKPLRSSEFLTVW